MLDVLLISGLTGICTGLGSLPFWFIRSLPRRRFDAILGFGAGLMLAAATLGLLTEALSLVRSDPAHDHAAEHALHAAQGLSELNVAQFLLVLVGFAMGFGILFLVERFIPHQHAGGHHEHLREGARFHADEGADHEIQASAQHVRKGLLISGALVFHRLPEGFAIGSGFAHQAMVPLGILVAVAVALQNVCEGMVMAAPLRAGGMGRLKVLLLTGATGLSVPLTAALGYAFSRSVAWALPFALALGAGSLISVTSNEIIPETHGHGSEGLATLGIVLGFVFFIVLRVGLGVH